MSGTNRTIEAIDELAEYRETTIEATASVLARCQTLAHHLNAMIGIAEFYRKNRGTFDAVLWPAEFDNRLTAAKAAIAKATEGEGS